MPIYHINIRTGSHIDDAETIERDDHTPLRLELARFVGDLMKDHAEQIWVDEDWQVDVSDEAGLILYVIHVNAMKTAATSQERG